MSLYEKPRWAIFGKQQHPLAHDLSDMFYTNARLPGGMTNPSEVLDYLISIMYPNYIGTYATPAALPVAPAANSYALVTDDGDGKSAGYIYQTLDGVSQWLKRYDVDWSMDNILAETVNRTQYMYVHKYGMSDKDNAGAEITGLYAGQTIFGGDKINQNLTLNANSFDGSGYVQVSNHLRPDTNTTYSLGTENEQWSKIWSDQGKIGWLTIVNGTITSDSFQIDFDGTDLLNVGDVYANSLIFTASTINDVSIVHTSPGTDYLISTNGAASSLILFADNVVKINKLKIDNQLALYSTLLIEPILSGNPKITSSTGTTEFAGTVLAGVLTSSAGVNGTIGTFTTSVISPLVKNSAGNLTLQSDTGNVLVNAIGVFGIGLQNNGSTKLQVSGTFAKFGVDIQADAGLFANVLSGRANTSTTISLNVTDITLSKSIVASTSLLDIGTTSDYWRDLYLSGSIKMPSGNITAATLVSLKDINVGVATNMGLFWNGTKWAASYADLEVNHNNITNLTTGDDHTQYALLAGRIAGQTINGDTQSGGSLTLSSTAHATKGYIFIDGTLVPAATYDIGDSVFKFRNIYATGQLFGARLENVTAPSFSASTVGRVYWNTSTSKLQVDTGISILDIGPGLTNPMTTGGDLIYGGTSGVPTRLANGNAGNILRSAGGTSAPTWTTATFPATTTAFALLASSAANTVSEITNGTTGQLLQATTSAVPAWATIGSTTQVIFNNSGSLSGSANFIWDNSNVRLALGPTAHSSITAATLGNPVQIISSNSSNASVNIFAANTGGQGPEINSIASEGTASTPTASISGKVLFDIKAWGHTGTVAADGAAVRFIQTAANVGTTSPTRISYFQTNDSGSYLNTFEMNRNGVLHGYQSHFGATSPSTLASGVSSSFPGFYSGTYTPTFTAINAVAANTVYAMQYMRVGNTVTVSGKVDVTPTGAATVSFNITVPVSATNFTNNIQAAGAGTFENGINAYIVVRMTADVGTTAMRVAFIAPSATAGSIFLTFTYQVI